MTLFLQGLGIASCVFTTGFLLAIGWHAGRIAATKVFGPIGSEHTLVMRDSDIRERQ